MLDVTFRWTIRLSRVAALGIPARLLASVTHLGVWIVAVNGVSSVGAVSRTVRANE